MAYSIVKGSLFRCYTGTVACTGLSVHQVVNTEKQAIKAVDKLYKIGETDLILVIDLETGQPMKMPD